MKTKIRPSIWKIAGTTAAALCAAVLALFVLLNLRLVYWPAADLLSGRIGFETFTERIHDKYVSETVGKYPLINLSGLYSRLTGRNICNGVMRLQNGMLTDYNAPRADMSAPAQGLAELAAFTNEQGGDFLYIQLPTKLDLQSELLIPGEEYHHNENADELLERLQTAGVETLDLRPALAQTPQQIEAYFFRTDHHWNFTGAFVAFQQLLQQLDARYPDRSIDLRCADWAQWQAHTRENWMLGSHGKRTGLYFGGTDDITWYTPLFETRMRCEILQDTGELACYQGDFTAANIRGEMLAQRPDWFAASPYDLYIGGEYGLVRHRSASAASDLRLLIIKDSFCLPLQAYLSTAFRSLDVLDPRTLKGQTAAEYIAETEPDLVLVMLSPNSPAAYPAYADYGVAALEK